MIKPDFIGDKIFYLNPSFTTVTTAVYAGIDGAIDNKLVLPYAYTATVRDDYDARNYEFEQAGVTAVLGTRAAFGLFLSPENDKHNLLFQVNGKVSIIAPAANGLLRVGFFFGRRATSNTVVSNGGSPQNSLAQFMYLPCDVMYDQASLNGRVSASICRDLFALELAGGFVYSFGFFVENHAASAAITGFASLSFRKYRDEIGVFRPSGG